VPSANAGAAVLGRFLLGPYGDGTTGTPPVIDAEDPPAYNGGTPYLAGDTVRNGSALTDLTFVAIQATTGNAPPTPPALSVYWAPITANDGKDGPGIQPKTRGKVYGPYIQEGKFKRRGLAILDGNDNPILYFYARPAKGGDLAVAGAYVNRASILTPTPTGFAGDAKNAMKYDADDNFEVFRRAGETDADVLHRIRAMLGDHNGNGTIETNLSERVVTETPYLLWSAGTDGQYGPDKNAVRDFNVLDILDADKCDDVVNFK
jgi:hypothetical protein